MCRGAVVCCNSFFSHKTFRKELLNYALMEKTKLRRIPLSAAFIFFIRESKELKE